MNHNINVQKLRGSKETLNAELLHFNKNNDKFYVLVFHFHFH